MKGEGNVSENTLNFDMYIHGEWRAGSTGDIVEVVNPAKGELLGTVPDGGQADLDAAVESASEGLAVWRETHPRVRSQVLFKIASTLQERAQEFAEIYSLNSGGSIGTGLWTMYDVAGRRFEYYAGLADKIRGDTFVTPGEFLSYTLREPVGVTGHIVPWNGPLWIGSRTIAPALAAGNSVVVKPSSEAPLTMLKFAELAHECGLPPGVLNVVTGRGSGLGNLFSKHPGFDGLYFTGSTATGRKILQNAATTNVRTVMELGGKSPNIVFEDADLDAALDGAIMAIFANSGQICVAGSRLLVQEVLDYIEAGKEEAELVAGGGTPDDPALQAGFFVSPTIFDGVPNTARIAREEIFGPVLSVTSFGDFDEAIALANDTDFGLASAVWTENVKTANLTAQALEAGQVYINHYYTAGFEVSRSPYKASGHGVSEGPDAIYEYLNQKSVSIKLGESAGW